MIKKTPISALALVLSLATLGRTATLYVSTTVANLFTILALVFLVLLILKLIMYPKQIVEETNLVVIPLLTLLPMALAALNANLIESAVDVALIIWYACLVLVALSNILYIKKIIIDKNYKMILPSTFVNLVGVDVLIVNKVPGINEALIYAILIYSIIAFVISIIVVTSLLIKYKNFSNITIPLMAIYAAPSALITVASISSGLLVNNTYLAFLLVFNVIGACIYFIALLKTNFKTFVPTFGAFTFPIVINAVAFRLLNLKLALDLKIVVDISYFAAIAIVLFISYKYFKHILTTNK